MSLRYLDYLFRPKSVAVVGASNRPRSIGSVVMRNLLQGGFSGPVMPVNPKYRAVAGVLAYPNVAALPTTPDLAVVCTPPRTVPDFVEDLGRLGTHAVIVMSTDLHLTEDSQGLTLQDRMMRSARQHAIRILGPDSLGLVVPSTGLNASFAHTQVQQGQIAFVSQSGAMCAAVLDWAKTKGIGFSHVVSVGGSADVDFGDVIDHLGGDPFTKSILLYINEVGNARNFLSAARSTARNKPIIVIKGGVAQTEKRSTDSHAGMMITSDEVYGAAFRRAGMLRVFEVDALFDAVETLARSAPIKGDRLAILSNGGGPGILATDSLLSGGGRLAELSPETVGELDQAIQSPWSKTNPVQIIDHAPGETYADALRILLKDPGVDAVLVLHVPTAFASSEDIAGSVVTVAGGRKSKVLTSWLGQESMVQARRMFNLAGIPTYETPHKAVGAFLDMVRYRRNQEMLMETPDSAPTEFTPNTSTARTMIREALAHGRTVLSAPEAMQVLAAYGIPIVETRLVEDVEEAVLTTRELGFPVTLKVVSPDLVHKSDVGGVALDLESAESVRSAAQAITARVRGFNEQARIDGFILQKMVRRTGTHELYAGVFTDQVFGPVIMFGQGGTAVEVISDRAVGLPPLNMALARWIIRLTRISKVLEGYREQSGVDMDAVRLTLMQISQMVIDLPEIVELDVNPLLADAQGVLVLDARMVIQKARQTGPERLAIRPYPKDLEECATLQSGRKVFLRPIRPEDEPKHFEFINSLSPEDIRMRFFGHVREFPHSQMARFTQIDYDREMAFIAVTQNQEGREETLGVNRVFFDPDNTTAEFAIVVRSDVKGQGLGSLLMEKVLRYVKSRGIQELTAHTLQENKAMKALGGKYGFTVARMEDDPDMIELRLKL